MQIFQCVLRPHFCAASGVFCVRSPPLTTELVLVVVVVVKSFIYGITSLKILFQTLPTLLYSRVIPSDLP